MFRAYVKIDVKRLTRNVCSGEFESESDAAQAWEDFFCASKGTLSVSEIAKIRDTVGVLGMAGS